MKIGLFTYVHLDEKELLDFNLVHHYIRHYINYGVSPKNITIIPYGYLNYEHNYEQFKSICSYYNVPILPIENFPYDFMIAHNRYLEWQKSVGEKFDWLLKTDIDEFISHGYYKPDEYLHFLIKNNFDGGAGWFVDCIDQNHILKDVNRYVNIFEQFPKRGMITKNIVRACAYKIVIFKSNIFLTIGNHGYSTPNVNLHNSISNKVYHFKWISNIKYRITMNKTRTIFDGCDWAELELSNTDAMIQNDRLII